MTVLITRPAPQAIALSEALLAKGIASYHTPLIDIIKGRDMARLTSLLTTLQAEDNIIMLSPQVSYMQSTILTSHHWGSSLNYFAIGYQSARLFSQLTQQVVVFPSREETSEALLALPELQQVEGKQVLLLRGNGGRELLNNTLVSRGATVHCIECYQRVPIHYDAIKLLHHWQQQQISVIVATSYQLLDSLVDIMRQTEPQSAWLYSLPLITISQRLAKYANRLGWKRVYQTSHANNHAIINCILSLNK